MLSTETAKDRAVRFAKIWEKSRADAGKTQEYMAKGLGVSRKTVQNWEKGETSPDLFMGSEWFRVLGLNPLPYYLAFVYPEKFEGVEPSDSDEIIDQAIMTLVKNSTVREKRELLFLMGGKHGSSWYSLLQMFTAHCHTSLKSRVNAARLIVDNYEMEEETGELICEENIHPDIAMLKRAIEESKKSVANGDLGYSNGLKKEEE